MHSPAKIETPSSHGPRAADIHFSAHTPTFQTLLVKHVTNALRHRREVSSFTLVGAWMRRPRVGIELSRTSEFLFLLYIFSLPSSANFIFVCHLPRLRQNAMCSFHNDALSKSEFLTSSPRSGQVHSLSPPFSLSKYSPPSPPPSFSGRLPTNLPLASHVVAWMTVLLLLVLAYQGTPGFTQNVVHLASYSNQGLVADTKALITPGPAKSVNVGFENDGMYYYADFLSECCSFFTPPV